ncbi:MAG TPA: PQQ-dependent sugar dehydrogenase, partial [Chroococcales cyanobacterium]
GTKDRGCVYAVSDANKDFKADRVRTIAAGLHMPNGVELRNGSLYIAEVNRITRLDNIDQNLDHPPRPVLVYDKLSDIEHHGWKYIRFGPDGWLYVPVGAPCNVCLREDPFAGISRMKPDGTEFQSFARGIRNTVGYDWDPDTKELWFTDNGRDWLGDDIPPDELNHAPRAGMHFGFPFRYGQNVVDNSDFSITMRTPKDVTFTPAARDLSPHIAALGMRFYTGKMFPKQYFHQIFIAEHGSWNRKSPLGARVMLVKLKDGQCISYEPFATGWQRKDGSRWGRPVDVINMPDGSMLVSDDEAGAIYRISYQADVKQ